MATRYKLLKETPDAIAGTIFESDGEDSGYFYTAKDGDERNRGWEHGNVVENNPEWFELLPRTEKDEQEELASLNDWFTTEMGELNERYKKELKKIKDRTQR